MSSNLQLHSSTLCLLVLLITGTAFGFLPGVTHAQISSPLSERVSEHGLDIAVCTYFGGTEQEWASKSDFDSEGNLVMTGFTTSTDLPIVNANQSTYAGLGDAFILKMNVEGEVIFATYFGGSGLEEAMALVVDGEDNIIIAGSTTSANLPLVNPIQDELNGTGDAFIAKFSPSGDLVFSTYFGGSGEERIERNGIDQYGNYIFTGQTGSDDYPTTSGVYQEGYGGGNTDIIVTALSEDCQTIRYSTYFGNSAEEVGLDVDIDAQGNLVVVGLTYAATNTTEGAYQRNYGGGQSDVIIAKLSPNCTDLVWSTMLGGNGWDFGDDVDFDSEGNIVISGYTGSTDFPLVNQLYNDSPNYDVFFAKLGPTGESLIFSSYLGGNLEDRSYGMQVLADDSIIVTSPASSTDMPTLNAIQSNNSGGSDGYVAIFSDDDLIFASYLGGTGNDYVMSISVYDESLIGIIAYTHSQNLKMLNPIQEEYAGNADIVIWILQSSTESTFDFSQLLIPAVIAASVLALVSIVIVRKKR